MLNYSKVDAGARLVGEFVDEAELPPGAAQGATPIPFGEAEKVVPVGTYLDLWTPADAVLEFTVLLRDNREITVRGHAVKFVPGSSTSAGHGSYGVIVRGAAGEEFVALFQASDVIGIFNGNMRPARESA